MQRELQLSRTWELSGVTAGEVVEKGNQGSPPPSRPLPEQACNGPLSSHRYPYVVWDCDKLTGDELGNTAQLAEYMLACSELQGSESEPQDCTD